MARCVRPSGVWDWAVVTGGGPVGETAPRAPGNVQVRVGPGGSALRPACGQPCARRER